MARLWRTAADGIVSIDRPGGTDRIFLLRGATVGDPGRRGTGRRRAVRRARLPLRRGVRVLRIPPRVPDFASEVRGARLPALAPLLAGLRLAADEPSYAEALAGSGDRVARRAAASGSVLRELAPDPDDMATLSAMDGRATVQDLVQGAGRPASLLWFLLRTGAAELGAAAGAGREATPDATPGETGLHAPA